MKKIFFPFIFSLLLPLGAMADQTDSRLQDLFQTLKTTTDPLVALNTENSIWQIWTESDNPRFNNLMNEGIQAMNRAALSEALDYFNQLVAIAPKFAEAWNKRATVYYLMKNYAASEADIKKTLELEPLHFGALSGQGLVYMAQGDYIRARHAFNEALEINPNMSGVQSALDAIQQYLNQTAI